MATFVLDSAKHELFQCSDGESPSTGEASVNEAPTEWGGTALVGDGSSIHLAGDPGTGGRGTLPPDPMAEGILPGEAGEGDGEEERGLSGLSPALPREALPIEVLPDMPPTLTGTFSSASMPPLSGRSKKQSLSSSVSPSEAIGLSPTTKPLGVPVSLAVGCCQSQL